MKKILRPCAAGGAGPRVWRSLAAWMLVVAAGTSHAAQAQAQAEAFEPCVLSPEKMGNPNPWVVKDAKPPDKPYRWEGYNDKLVDTCLGPNRYRIPANHFYDQMGPDFQGSVTLLMPDAAVARDGAGMRAVGRVFIASDAAQQWLQAGRDHNQAERDAAPAAQQAQALAQQAAALQAAPQQSGPVMRM